MESLIAYLIAVLLTVNLGLGTGDIYMAEGAKATGIVFIGDSRTVGLAKALDKRVGKNVFFVGKTGAGYYWFKENGEQQIRGLKETHTDIINWIYVLNFGVNDPENREKYSSEYIRLKKNEWEDSSVYVCAVNPVDDRKITSISNKDINDFNKAMKYSLTGSGIEYIDSFYDMKFSTNDGLHYTDETYRKLYEKELYGLSAKMARQEEAILTGREESAQRRDNNGRNASVNIIGTGQGLDLAMFACQFVGNPYVYGGTSLTNGCDCSGFVQSVYAHYGYSLARASYDQATEGIAVSREEARAGDIFYYGGHVAIYLGDNNIVHASTPKGGIKINSASYRQVRAIRRIIL